MKNLIILINEDTYWEEIISFTKLKKGGVNIDELLAIL